jgi:uncharacterized protein YgbK (DUF1537 family)
MMKLRLVADDLTGALDAGAQFAGEGRVIPVYMGHRLPGVLPEEFAVDLASREREGVAAAAIASASAHLLAPASGSLPFKKVDSLLRGNPGLEIAAVLRALPGVRCVIAPAFPFQGRVMRGGLQYVLREGVWLRTGEDLGAILESQGIAVRRVKAGEAVAAGVSLWDSETDDDLRRIADSGVLSAEPTLWCGSGGLAGCLAPSNGPFLPAARIGRPFLGIFGSNHPVTSAQLLACGEDVLGLRDFGPASSRLVCDRLAGGGVCHVRIDLPPGLDRPGASARIAAAIGELTRCIPMPRSVLVAGGETLRALCVALETDHLELVGQLMPGVPVSRMVGGSWDGAEVISKSGAFGHSSLLQEMAPHRGA